MADQYPGDLTPLATGTFFEQPVQPASTTAVSNIGDLTIGSGNLVTGTHSFLQSEFTQFAEERHMQKTTSVAIAIDDPIGGSKSMQSDVFSTKPFNQPAIGAPLGDDPLTNPSNFMRFEPASRLAEFDPLAQINDLSMPVAVATEHTKTNVELKQDKGEKMVYGKKQNDSTIEWDLDATYHLNAWLVPRNIEMALRKYKPGQRDQSAQAAAPSIVQEHMQTDLVREMLQASASQQVQAGVVNSGETDTANLPILPDENAVAQDVNGVRQLIERECYRGAANLCARLLIQAGFGTDKKNTSKATKSANPGPNPAASVNSSYAFTSYSATLWHLRCSLLMKLRQYNILEAELATFGSVGLTFDRADFQLEYYNMAKSDSSQSQLQNEAYKELVHNGVSIIPFGLRVIYAELPQFVGKPLETLDRLYALLAICRNVLSNLEAAKSESGVTAFQKSISVEDSESGQESSITIGPFTLIARKRADRDWSILAKKVWTERERCLILRIANAQFSMKDYAACVQTLESLLRVISQAAFLQNCSLGGFGDQPDAIRRKLLLLLLRTHLHAGDIDSADYYFGRIVAELNEDEKQRSLVLFNKALLFAARGDYEDARQYFKDALVASSGSNSTASVSGQISPSGLGAFGRSEEDPRAGALLNNVAVCSLYTGKLRDAIELLEQLIRNEPGTYLHEAVLFNLSTLYELESTRAAAKKRSLLEQVARVRGDAFNVACLKIQTS